MNQLLRVELLIIDDWGLQPLTAPQRNDLIEIIENRHVRLLNSAHRLELIGDSMQKTLKINLIRKLQKLTDRDRLRYVLTTSVELSVTFAGIRKPY